MKNLTLRREVPATKAARKKRRKYKLTGPLKQAGVSKKPGDTVELRAEQAERHKDILTPA